MERLVGIEEARASLGRLVDEVSGGDPVVLARRGRAVAVLIDPVEYDAYKQFVAEQARAELAERLGAIRRTVHEAGLDPSVVDDAIAAARRV